MKIGDKIECIHALGYKSEKENWVNVGEVFELTCVDEDYVGFPNINLPNTYSYEVRFGKTANWPIHCFRVVKDEESKEIEKATRYNEGKTDWSQLFYPAIEPMVRVLMFGAQKYNKDNWKKYMSREDILNSSMRHLVALFNGIENDEETKLSHAAHVMTNMMFYLFHYVINKK